LKLLSNHKMRQGAVELLRDPDIRGMLLQPSGATVPPGVEDSNQRTPGSDLFFYCSRDA
jgi:hypothetical protein